MTSVRRIETVFALTVLLAGASISMVSAQPQEARLGNPHISVSSDGTVPTEAAEINSDFAESFEGLGPVLETAGARFDETGAVRETRLITSSGHDSLDRLAQDLMRETARFSPALNRDQRVPVWIQLPVTFQTR